MLTETEIAFRLGLKPWEVMQEKAQNYGVYPRGSGRTTRMLVAAVAAAQTERVAIAAHTNTLARNYARQARQMCDAVGINPTNIVGHCRFRTVSKEVRETDVKVFYDHWLGPDFPNS
jgi:lambda repressor-like predicted transcriptional regulator